MLVENIEGTNSRKAHNLCRQCGTRSTYIPTPQTIASKVKELLASGSGDPARNQYISRRLDRIRSLVMPTGRYGSGREIAAKLGVSYASLQKIREGKLKGHKKIHWCSACRATVTIWPCVLCKSQRHATCGRKMADASHYPPNLAERLDWPIISLGLDQRMVNTLDRAGFVCIGHLVAASQQDMERIADCSTVSLRAVRKALSRLGFGKRAAS